MIEQALQSVEQTRRQTDRAGAGVGGSSSGVGSRRATRASAASWRSSATWGSGCDSSGGSPACVASPARIGGGHVEPVECAKTAPSPATEPHHRHAQENQEPNDLPYPIIPASRSTADDTRYPQPLAHVTGNLRKLHSPHRNFFAAQHAFNAGTDRRIQTQHSRRSPPVDGWIHTRRTTTVS